MFEDDVLLKLILLLGLVAALRALELRFDAALVALVTVQANLVRVRLPTPATVVPPVAHRRYQPERRH